MASKVVEELLNIEERISKMSELRGKRNEIDEDIKKLSKPLVSDRALISTIYEWFKDILFERDCPPNPESPHQRKKFLFIILSLYNPGFFMGDKMLYGLRRDLADCLGVGAESVISDNCSDLLFIYRHYKEFSGDVEGLIMEIKRRLAP